MRPSTFALTLLSGLLLLGACSSSSPGQAPSPSGAPHPSVSTSATSASSAHEPLPEGVYAATITIGDTDRSPDGHIINLGTQLTGRYRLSMSGGAYTVTLDGRSAVPTPSPRRTGGEGAYARYGFWIFLGVPPIGHGTYSASASRVVFHSDGGACFQKGARTTLTTGTYAWTLRGGSLQLSAGGPDQGPSADGCLGRRFVFTAHPWVRQA